MAKKFGSKWLAVQTAGIAGLVGYTWRIAKELGAAGHIWVKDAENLPQVTVIVPARNEERNIERCVRSLLAQDYPNYEFIVVDDGSTDRTPEILANLQKEYPQLKVVRLDGQLPEGWAGKPHAMHAGYEVAQRDSAWLLFSDADTYHYPHALRYAVATAAQENVGLYSVLPELELKSFWEKVLMPTAVLGITFQYPLEEVNQPDNKIALANGQFLLLRRDAFEKVGGWSGKLRNSLIDDRDMALAIKQAGERALLMNGSEIMTVRMYTNLAEIWNGFSKNAFVGSRAPYFFVPFVVLTGFFFGILPFLQLPYALLRCLGTRGKKGKSLLAFSVLQVGLTTYSRRRIDRRLNVPAPYAATVPLAFLVFLGIIIDSTLRSLSKRGVSWKGRTYSEAAKNQQII